MKKIKDERLIIKNLKHIRLAHIIQTIGIISILVYEGVTKGIDAVYLTPLWWVFRLTITVMLFSTISMSIEHDEKARSPKKFLTGWIIFGLILSLGVIIIGKDQVGIMKALLAGLVSFIVSMIPGGYIYYLLKRKKELIDADSEL